MNWRAKNTPLRRGCTRNTIPLTIAAIVYIAAQVVLIPTISEPAISLIVSLAAVVPLAYFMIFGTRAVDHYALFKLLSLYGTTLLSLSIAALFIFSPYFADWLAREDFIVENITAVVTCLAAVVVAVVAFHHSVRKRLLLFITTLVIAFAFFVVGMEEISWGQRIFNIEANQFFVENNWQGETNLHNLHTTIAMAVFYVATFIIFVIIPFYRKVVDALLSKIKLKSLEVLIPSDWLTIVFAGSVGFMAFAPDHQYQLFILIFTSAILLYKLLFENGSPRFAIYTSIVVITLSLLVTLSPNFGDMGLRPYFFYEWREMLVCLTLLIYAIDLAFRLRISTRAN